MDKVVAILISLIFCLSLVLAGCVFGDCTDGAKTDVSMVLFILENRSNTSSTISLLEAGRGLN